MNIAMAASEMTPYAKTGGLADVMGALPHALGRRGHAVSVFIPAYRGVDRTHAKVLWKDKIWIGQRPAHYAVLCVRPMEGGVAVYAIRKEEYFDRSHLYGTAERDYEDNAERFIFFSQAVLQSIEALRMAPDLIHAHDWPAALIPLYDRQRRRADGRPPRPTVFTIHNLAYQGIFPPHEFSRTNLPANLFSIDGLEFYGQMNLMKGGILFADAITTVSRRYAREIQTPDYGCNLDGALRSRSASLRGIANGVDYSVWNPETDPHLAQPYGAAALQGRAICKEALRSELGFSSAEEKPLFGMVTRLAHQKGIDLLIQALPEMLHLGVRLAILGGGDAAYEEGLRQWADRHPDQIQFRTQFNDGLARRIFAGSDFLLVPSLYEPCGLSQLYAMRYGSIPVARATGGLEDTIQEWNAPSQCGTGFKFDKAEPRALLEAMRRALQIYRRPKIFSVLQKNAMAADFSWDRSSAEYETLYQSLKNHA